MLTSDEFRALCQRLKLSSQAQIVLDRIRSSPPSRRVSSNGKNMPVQYASPKMGITIQAESYKVEFAGAYEMNHDPNTHEFYDQPPPIMLHYQAKRKDGKTRPIGVLHTPDYFVIRSDSLGWEEWKEEEELIHLSKTKPNRYQLTKDGRWYCPPGENVAARLGFYYTVRSSREINWVLQRNLRFLSYYWSKNCPPVLEAAQKAIHAFVSAHPGIDLDTLLKSSEGVRSDDVYTLIASEQLYVDIYAASIPERERLHIFTDKDTANAWSAMFTKTGLPAFPPPHTISTQPNTPILYDDCPWIILQVGKSETHLLSQDKTLIKLPNERFEALVAEGKIRGEIEIPERKILSEEATKRFTKASKSAREEANRRFELIKSVLRGHAPDRKTSLGRAMRRWVAKFREAEQSLGSGYLGLLPEHYKSGNRKPRIDEATIKIIDDFIKNEYENNKQKNIREVYGEFENHCKDEGNTAITSYKTFAAVVNNRPRHEQVEKRAGSKAAYPHEPLYWELLYTLPRCGDRPFEVVHIDHTLLNIELVDTHTGQNLGRPWLTLLIDAYSRRILAVYVTFDKPSYRSCMMVLRECVSRHKRFPEMVIVDWGKEFQSVYFESLLARYQCSKATRPKSKPRYGAVMERIFNTSQEELIHNLDGNTQVTQNVRQMTPAVDPKKHAVWTLGTLYAALQQWAYEEYDTNSHPALGQTPHEAFNQGMFWGGTRDGQILAYDNDFVRDTLPSTPKGTATIQGIRGVKIKNIYYWAKGNVFNTYKPSADSKSKKDRTLKKYEIPIRYDPYDVGHAYAFVNGEWVECLSEYHVEFRGHTELEIQLATEELRRNSHLHGEKFNATAAKLARFITSLEGKAVLLAQRRKDAELREVFALMGKDSLGLHGIGINKVEPSSVPSTRESVVVVSEVPFVGSPEKSDDDDDIYEVVIAE